MKAVLISIQPKWCELIASGKKTVEVRKTKPKLETPFKAYIYETKDKKFENIGVHWENGRDFIHNGGKVIGEFVCRRIEELYQCNSGWVQAYACLSRDKFFDYLGIPRKTHLGYDKKAYGWLISDLVIYDKPKELREFRTPCKMTEDSCYFCDYAVHGMDGDLIDCDTSLTRPPQSWCYVEEVSR